MDEQLPVITERRRIASPAATPQALAWDGQHLWMSSRDLKRVYVIDPDEWSVVEEIEPPGIPWAAARANDGLRFTIGEGANDDRYVYRYTPAGGFTKLFACPEFTGSYLSFDGEHLYMSQWYKGRIIQFEDTGKIRRTIEIGPEISGLTFVGGSIYVLQGTEQNGESWRIARFDPKDAAPSVENIAVVPFACRSLAFDGDHFWSNHRAANETISFSLP